ncbi:MAG: hypothetical protein OXU20_17375 [Myxococcales bacterium]|nr:hypothetical protein [Myxococcales bacterium]
MRNVENGARGRRLRGRPGTRATWLMLAALIACDGASNDTGPGVAGGAGEPATPAEPGTAEQAQQAHTGDAEPAMGDPTTVPSPENTGAEAMVGATPGAVPRPMSTDGRMMPGEQAAPATGTDPDIQGGAQMEPAGESGESTESPAGDEPAGNGMDPGSGVDEPAMAGPILPPVDEPGDSGPFSIQVVNNLEGLPTHILIAPEDLGRDGIKHPILVWINGAGQSSNTYRNMLDNVAAHGFFLLDDKQSTFDAIQEIGSQKDAIDWVIAQAKDPSSPYHGKIDETRIAIAGQSLGSVASFGNVGDPRITTSIHIAGGVTGNPGGVDNDLITKVSKPAAFLCGSADRNGLGRVRNDYSKAPASAPVFFSILDGVTHTSEFNDRNGGRWGQIVVAWLRWQLADDESMGARFMGDNCEFCMGDWETMKQNLD